MSSLSIAILIPVVIFIFLALVFAYSSRVKKVGPNEVLVISGRGSGHQIAAAIAVQVNCLAILPNNSR